MSAATADRPSASESGGDGVRGRSHHAGVSPDPGEVNRVVGRWAWAEIDLDAVAQNVGVLREVVAPAAVWAVVKADAYGHGAVPVATAVLRAGAAGLCVALVQEGVELRRAGVAAPILILSQQPDDQVGEIVDHGLSPTVYTASGMAALDHAVAERGRAPYGVHLKIDTGMSRVGAPVSEASALIQMIRGSAGLRLEGVFTHLAVADEPEHPANARQLVAFTEAIEAIEALGRLPEEAAIHALNSAGAIAFPQARHAFVRVGIALYGINPGPGLLSGHRDVIDRLRPALSLRARVGFVKQIQPGDGVSYGLRFVAAEPMWVATIPIGYADGVPRSLAFHGGEVLIGGVRRRVLGVVTMDQIVVAVDEAVQPGDEVVLIGRQGADEVRVEEWAERTGTIGYDIVCAISPRIARHHRGGPAGH
jgi:alanine racemase